MAVSSISFISIQEAKTWLGITVDVHDTLLESIVNGIAALMERETGRKLKARDYSYVDGDEEAILDGNSSTVMYLPQYPVNSITKLLINNSEKTCTNSDYSDSSGYKWWSSGKIEYEYSFDSYRKNVKLIYNAGFASGSAGFDDLAVIQKQLVSYVWQRRRKEAMKSEKILDYSYTIGDADMMNTPMVKRLHDSYKREATG